MSGFFHFAVMLRNASQISLMAASSLVGIQGDDLLIKARKTTLAVADWGRIEATMAVTGNRQHQFAIAAEHHLLASVVAMVA